MMERFFPHGAIYQGSELAKEYIVGDVEIDRLPRTVKGRGLVLRILNNQVKTFSIPREKLSDYLSAALATGFRAKEIAAEGESFVTVVNNDPSGEGQSIAISHRSVEKGHVAISIRKPEGSKGNDNFFPFWDKLKNLQ